MAFLDGGSIQIDINRLLGKGSFARVYYGIYENRIECAIKRQVQSGYNNKLLATEIAVLQQHNHSNLVRYYAYKKIDIGGQLLGLYTTI